NFLRPLRVARLVALLLSSMKPDRRVGTFGRMSRFSEPEFFETVLPGRGVCHAARIRDRFGLPALDKGRPKRDGNQPCAHQRRSGEDYNPHRDRDGLLASIGVSPWTESGPRHCHCFPHFLAQAKLSQHMAYPSWWRRSGTEYGRL